MSEPIKKRAWPREAVTVRVATPDDSEAIARVLFEAFSTYREHYTSEAFEVVTPKANEVAKRFAEGAMWVAERDQSVVGTVSMTTEPEGLYIRSMAVSPVVQGLGVGHKLLDALEEYISASEIGRIFLYTTYFVPGAKELYEKHGFRWVRDTTAEEWYGTPGLEMDKERVKEEKENVVGS